MAFAVMQDLVVEGQLGQWSDCGRANIWRLSLVTGLQRVPMLGGNFSGLRRDAVREFTGLFIRTSVPYIFSE